MSDHGEEFREHGGSYHLTTLFDEQVRVPGWLVAGPRALDDAQRAALAAWADRRTFTRDVHATMLDLLGVLGTRSHFPFAGRLFGRSLLRTPDVYKRQANDRQAHPAFAPPRRCTNTPAVIATRPRRSA